MWASPCLSPPTPLHPPIPKPRLNITVVSAKSHSQPSQDLGGLGRTSLTQLKSNTKPTNLGKQKKQDEGSSSREISGSDVLFAMQKAAATKKRREKKRTSKREVAAEVSSSSVGRYMVEEEEEERVDYSKVRALCVKSDWSTRLDELEMRLQELSSSQTI